MALEAQAQDYTLDLFFGGGCSSVESSSDQAPLTSIIYAEQVLINEQARRCGTSRQLLPPGRVVCPVSLMDAFSLERKRSGSTLSTLLIHKDLEGSDAS